MFLVGWGYTWVSCCNEKCERWEYKYSKECFGPKISAGAQITNIEGMSGENCRPSTYEGWFFEFGVSVGPVGVGMDIGVDEIGEGPLPGAPAVGGYSGVHETTYGLGGAKLGVGAAWCKYTYTGESVLAAEPCDPEE